MQQRPSRSDKAVDKVVFICPSFNIETNVNALVDSLQSQSNGNWECFVIDDISSDQTYEKLLEKTKGDSRFKIIKNTTKKYALRNIVECARELDESIVAVVDGDDSLCNNEAVNILFDAYSDGSEVVWTAHRWDTNGMNISGPIPEKVNPYFWPWRSSHLRTFKASLLSKITDRNFQNIKGAWFKRGYDQALMLPLMHVSKKFKYVPEVCYLYNIDSSSIPSEERNWCEMEQISTINFVRARGFLK